MPAQASQVVTWIATVSDGNTVAENEGEYTVIPGERSPWVRLCTNVAQSGQYLTSLRLRIGENVVHMPRFNPKFGHKNVFAPLYYSLEHILEWVNGGNGSEQSDYLDAAAHYDGYSVHFLVSIDDPTNSWIEVRDNAAMAPSPRRQ